MNNKLFPGNKTKALTFSYDDGILQDRRFINILNKYDLKCTFNINSGLLGNARSLYIYDRTVAQVRPQKQEVRKIYEGHEIAVHTLTHPCLKDLSDGEVIRQVEEDRLALSEIAGYEVIGMAYPGGTGCFDDRVAELIRTKTGVKYSRTTTSTFNFDLQEDLIRFNPTVFHLDPWDRIEKTAEDFINLKTETPKIFYIWGHTYEFDLCESYWERFEELCKYLSGRNDIFYGNNKEVLL